MDTAPPSDARSGETAVDPRGGTDREWRPSRASAHLAGSAVGLVLTPFALLWINHGLTIVENLESFSYTFSNWPWAVVGALLLAVVVVAAARWSGLALIVCGAVWGVLPGLMGAAVSYAMIGPAVTWSLPGLDAASRAAMTGKLLVLGGVLVGAGVAAEGARRYARRRHEPAVTEPDAVSSTAAPTLRSRVLVHIVGVIAALALAIGGAALLGDGVLRRRLAESMLEPAQDLRTVLAAVLLLLVMILGARTSIGPVVAGLALALVVSAIFWLATIGGPVGEVVSGLFDQDWFITLGPAIYLPGVGLAMVVTAAAAPLARRAGRRG